MRSTSLGRSLAFLILVTVLFPLIAQERRVALVIGNGNYAFAPRLANPANDAQDMAQKLESLGFSVTKLVDGGLGDLLKAQSDFAEAAKGAGLRLFYYAGHGIQAGGENWLLPVDAEVREDYELKAKALSAQLVLDGLRAAGQGVNIVILDACRDNPFKAASRGAGASRGLAVMGTSGSLIAYATGPGAAAADGKGRNGIFTGALLARLDSPGLSLQEIMTSVAADVVAATKGAQEPWKQDNLTRMVYFVTPEEAQARFAQRIAKGQGELEALDAQLAGLRERLGKEGDAAKKQALELEIKRQAALQAQKRQEAEALAAERERQAQAERSQAAMAAQLASYMSEAAGREEALRLAAEAKRRELESAKAGGGGVLPSIFAIEAARQARADLGGRYAASLAAVAGAVAKSYDDKLSALAAWAEEPWENAVELKARIQAERARLESQKRAALEEARSANAGKRAEALAPFDAAERKALADLESARILYAGAQVRLSLGAFDKDEKCFPIEIVSEAPELPYRAKLRYSIKSGSAEELKRRYLEFDSWSKAGALFGEIEASVRSLGEGGFANLVEALRLKALDGGGEKVLLEERLDRPVSRFAGSADQQKPRPVATALVVSAPGALLLLDGIEAGRDRAFLLEPKPGSHAVKAILPDGTVLEERRNVVAGSVEELAIQTSGSVEVEVRTAGELWLDGARLGRAAPGSPFLAEGLPPGAKTFELRHDGLPIEAATVRVRARERSKLAFSADPAFALVPAGSFSMGSPPTERDRDYGELQHEVRLSPFMIGRRELTQAEWAVLMGPGSCFYKGDSLPAESMSWYGCLVYCNRRSIKEGLRPCYSIGGSTDPERWGPVPKEKSAAWDQASCDFAAEGYRLPTEAEWEYAAEGGAAAPGLDAKAVYAGSERLDEAGWYVKNSGDKTHPTGQKRPNALGLFDMAGNVWEWCWDWYSSDYYKSSPAGDPRGAASGSYRVMRGGMFKYEAARARSSRRDFYSPHLTTMFTGLRLVRSASGSAAAGAAAAAPRPSGEPGELALSDFSSFLGLGPEDRIDAAIKLLGPPTGTDKNAKEYSFDDCYWELDGEGALNISFDKASRKIIAVRVTAYGAAKAEALLRRFRGKGIDDAKLGLLGQAGSTILGLFGKPGGQSAGSYVYQAVVGGRKAIVTFACYDALDGRCGEIAVHWL